jgi:hypothetical protein
MKKILLMERKDEAESTQKATGNAERPFGREPISTKWEFTNGNSRFLVSLWDDRQFISLSCHFLRGKK